MGQKSSKPDHDNLCYNAESCTSRGKHLLKLSNGNKLRVQYRIVNGAVMKSGNWEGSLWPQGTIPY